MVLKSPKVEEEMEERGDPYWKVRLSVNTKRGRKWDLLLEEKESSPVRNACRLVRNQS